MGCQRVDVGQVHGDTAARGLVGDGAAFAVNPDAGPRLAAQFVHGIGIVEGVGLTAVFFKVQGLAHLAGDEIYAFGRAQIATHLLVALGLTVDARKCLPHGQRAALFKIKQCLVGFIHGHQRRR